MQQRGQADHQDLRLLLHRLFLWFFILAFFQIPFGAWVNDRLADLNLELIPFEKRSGWRLPDDRRRPLDHPVVDGLFADAYVPYLVRQWRLRREAKAAQAAPAVVAATAEAAAAAAAAARWAAAVELEMSAARDSERFPTPDRRRRLAARRRRHVTRSAAPRWATATGAVAAAAAAAGGRADAGGARGGETPYDPMLDYSGIVIQFGYVTRLGRLTRSPHLSPRSSLYRYVTMFSAVWPLAALVCLGHTIFRPRSNVLRLTRLSMRPVPGRRRDRAVAQPAALRGARVRARQLPDRLGLDRPARLLRAGVTRWREEGDCEQGSVPMTSRFLIAVAAEHIVLGLVFLIDQGVPNMQTQLTLG